jgi:hypothetical protein
MILTTPPGDAPCPHCVETAIDDGRFWDVARSLPTHLPNPSQTPPMRSSQRRNRQVSELIEAIALVAKGRFP